MARLVPSSRGKAGFGRMWCRGVWWQVVCMKSFAILEMLGSNQSAAAMRVLYLDLLMHMLRLKAKDGTIWSNGRLTPITRH